MTECVQARQQARGRRAEVVEEAHRDLVPRGLELFDLEHDMGCFNKPLPRLRVIPLDEFDPNEFL